MGRAFALAGSHHLDPGRDRGRNAAAALSSVTQSNNAKFLPASAPSQHAIDLSAPFGNASLIPIPVIAATTSGPLTPADVTALTTMGRKIAADPSISQVKDVGQSANGQAVQLLALAKNNSANRITPRTWSTACGRGFAARGCPPGCGRTWRATPPSRSMSRRRPAIPATRCRTCRWSSSSSCWC